VKGFVEAHGQLSLANVLLKMVNNRKVSSLAPTPVADCQEFDREYNIVRCLKALVNTEHGADDALANQ
jgi:cytokinesis protein